MAAPTALTPSNTSAISSGSENVANTGSQQLINILQSAATAVDRIKLLPIPSDHVYDFLNLRATMP
jgi:hypothetical protein